MPKKKLFFASLEELVAHYRENTLTGHLSSESSMRLSDPCPAPPTLPAARHQGHMSQFGLPLDVDLSWLAVCLPDGSLLELEDLDEVLPAMQEHQSSRLRLLPADLPTPDNLLDIMR